MKKQKLFSRRDDQRVGIIFASPFILGFIFLFLGFVIDGIVYAFSSIEQSENGMKPIFNGIENFYYALRVDVEFTTILFNTLKDMVTLLPMIMFFSLFVAVLLNSKIYCRTFFRAIFFLPVMITSGLITKLDYSNEVLNFMSAASAADDGSGLNTISMFLQSLKFSPSLISFVSNAAESISELVTLSGVQILLFLAAIQSISPSVYEAADVEGATGWEKFWKITLPMVMPVGVVCLLYTVIDYLMRDTTPVMKYIQGMAFSHGKFSEASAMAVIYCLCIVVGIVLCVGVFLIFKKKAQKGAQG